MLNEFRQKLAYPDKRLKSNHLIMAHQSDSSSSAFNPPVALGFRVALTDGAEKKL